jgi:hypothetical protein
MSAPKRNTSSGLYHMQTTWKLPSAVTNEKSNSRATYITVRTMLDCWVNGKFSRIQQDVNLAGNATEIVRSLDWITVGNKTWRRADYWPLTNRKLGVFWTHVKLCNAKGSGPWQSTSAEFKVPRKPAISQISQDKDSGNLTCTITTDEGNDLYDRWDTRYIVDMYNSIDNTTETTDTTSRSTSFNVTRDASARSLLKYDQFIRMRVRACARGLRGDSDWEERNCYVSWPPLPVVRGIDVSTTDPSGKVTVRVGLKQDDPSQSKEWNTTYNTQHPVTGCRLEILRNTSAETPKQAAASESWSPMDYSDNGNCYALSATVTDLASERGLHSWVRVKSWNEIEEIFYRYSNPVEVEKLFLAPPSESESGIEIVSARSGGNGSSAILTLGWNASGADTMTGTEVSWSDNPNAWRSTVEPDTHEFTWSDGELASGGTTYHDSATIYVDGLTNGTLYHFRARRYQDRDTGDRLYGEYNQSMMTAIPTTSPSSVTLHAPNSVAVGRPLEITWSYDSESMQTAYEVVTGTVENSTDSEGNETHWIADDGLGIIATGSDSRGSFVLSADAIDDMAVGDSIALAVRVSTGGEFVTSQATIVTIDMPPVAGLQVGEVTSQPASATVTSNVGTASVTLSVVSQGADGSMPDGSIAQVSGDVVWAGTVTPDWSGSDGSYSATVQLPDNLSLYDGAGYTVNARLADESTGLSSEPVSGEFLVNWEHQAPAPPDSISVVGTDTTDNDGIRTIYATITLQEPDGAADGDLYDVYRILDDEVQLIAEGRALDGVVTDNFAPFGNRTLAYRVACRTVDGDVDWDDYQYELLPRGVTDGLMMRVDFGGEYVELDRGVSYSDRKAKTFAGRSHMGEMTQRGYWGDEIKRSGQSSAAAIMVYEQDVAEALDALAVYRGPCYVRISTGVAYEADVQVSGPNITVGSAGMQYTLAITKVALTQEYTAAPIVTDASDEVPEGGE